MGTIASQITSLTIVYSTVYSDADQRKHQSSASLAFVWGIHRYSPQKWPATRKIFPFDDVITDYNVLAVTVYKTISTAPLLTYYIFKARCCESTHQLHGGYGVGNFIKMGTFQFRLGMASLAHCIAYKMRPAVNLDFVFIYLRATEPNCLKILACSPISALPVPSLSVAKPLTRSFAA